MAYTKERRNSSTHKIIALLGGRRVFRKGLTDRAGLQQALRVGFPFGAFEALVDHLDVTSRDLSDLIGVAPRTFARRKASRRLSPIESDRLYRIAFITQLAEEVLGSPEQAKGWLQRGNQALGGESPVAVLDTEIGERQVEELLNRVSHGIYS